MNLPMIGTVMMTASAVLFVTLMVATRRRWVAGSAIERINDVLFLGSAFTILVLVIYVLGLHRIW